MTLAMILAACGSFQSARTLALDGKYEQAEKILQCRVKASPATETDSKVLLADMAWWQGQSSKSRELSADVLSTPSLEESTQYRLSDRVTRTRLNVSALELFTEGHTGTEAGVAINTRIGESSSIGASYDRRGRSYGQGVVVSDDLVGVNGAIPFDAYNYVEWLARFAIDPVFSPKQTYRVEPHQVFGGQNDFSIAAQMSIYNDETVPQFELGWQAPVSENWILFARLYLTFPKKTLPSVLLGADVRFSYDFHVRFGVGGGRSYDGGGLINDLITVSATPSYRINKTFSIEVPISADFGNLRDEYRVGLGAECRF